MSSGTCSENIPTHPSADTIAQLKCRRLQPTAVFTEPIIPLTLEEKMAYRPLACLTEHSHTDSLLFIQFGRHRGRPPLAHVGSGVSAGPIGLIHLLENWYHTNPDYDLRDASPSDCIISRFCVLCRRRWYEIRKMSYR